MTHIDFIKEELDRVGDAAALGFQERTVSGGALLEEIDKNALWLVDQGIKPGDAVVLVGDFSIDSVSLMLALINMAAITIPVTPATLRNVEDQMDAIQPDHIIDVSGGGRTLQTLSPDGANAHYVTIRERGLPGLVLFTSGSTGKPKAVVHDYAKLLSKFRAKRSAMITLNFLLFDHWGGLNTLLHSLANGSLLVLPENRKPDDVCALIERYGIELLPATPSFLNMLLISGAADRHDLSSLKVISYGAEPMPASTLARLRETFPDIDLRQTYGMIELGVLRAKSRDDGSLWVKLGGEGYDLRVVDDMLQIKADAAMLGYINHESPITEDGYFKTGDLVEQDGDYLKILGRKSDLINVGGQKVYPAEVETILLDVPGVIDASVYGQPHVMLGKIVCARVVVPPETDEAEMRKTIKRYCGERMQPYMVPVRIEFEPDTLQNHRLKRQRL
ncbi:MAG: class I adenylate-forming enzyme family protein [Brevundimonas sp.]